MSGQVAKIEDEQVVSDTTAIIQVIERAASNPAVDIEKMERLLAMQERILDRNAKQAFSEAMNAVQEKLRPIAADASNPQTKSKYASYTALDKVIRPIYSANGFALSFGTGDGAPENYVRVTCDVLHTAGHEKHYHVDMPADGKGAKGGDVMTKTHAAGSAMSYGQRYLLKLIFNITVGEDDDGNGANGSDPRFITEDQEAALSAKAAELGVNLPAFLKYFNVASLSEIPAHQYANAVAAMERKRGKQ